MRNWAKWRPSPSMVVAMLALFVALGGSALAVKKGGLKIRSKNIVNGQVKTPDLANNGVTSVKIRNGQVQAPDIGPGAVGSLALAPGSVGGSALAPGSVGSQHVQDNSLNGGDIDESSLQGVNAQTLGGAKHCGGAIRITVGISEITEQTLCTIGGSAYSRSQPFARQAAARRTRLF